MCLVSNQGKCFTNVFNPAQEDDGSFDFTSPLDYTQDDLRGYINGGFDEAGNISTTNEDGWKRSCHSTTIDKIEITGVSLVFTHGSEALNIVTSSGTSTANVSARVYNVRQKIDVSGMDFLDLSATANSSAASSGVRDAGLLRIGLCCDGSNGGTLLHRH